MESIDWDIYAKSYEDTQHLVGRPDLAQKHYEMIGKEQGRDPGFDAVLVYCTQPVVESVNDAKDHFLKSTAQPSVRSRKNLIQVIKSHPDLAAMLPDVNDYLVEPAVDSALFQLHIQQEKVSVEDLISKIVQDVTNELLSETVDRPIAALESNAPSNNVLSRSRAGVVKVKQRAPCLIDVDCLIPVLDAKAYLISGYYFDPENQLTDIRLQAGSQTINIRPALKQVVRQDCYEHLLSRGVPVDLLDQDVGFAVLVPAESFQTIPTNIICQFSGGDIANFTPSVRELNKVPKATLQAIWQALFNEFFAYFNTDIDELDHEILTAVMDQEKPVGYDFNLEVDEMSVVDRSLFLRLTVIDPDARLKSLYLRTPSGRHVHLSERLVMQLESSSTQFTAFLENLYLASNTAITVHALLEDGQWSLCQHSVTLSTPEKVRDYLLRFWNLRLMEHSRQVLEKLIEPSYSSLFSKNVVNTKGALQTLSLGSGPSAPQITLIINLRSGFHTVRNLMGMLSTSPHASKIELLFVVDRMEQVGHAEQLFKSLYAIYELPCTVLGSLEPMGSADLSMRASKVARGETLVFFAGNVIPKHANSIFQLADYSRLHPKCIAAPVIMNSDDSIYDFGITFTNQNEPEQFWLHDSPWRGFSMSMLNVASPIEVPAVSAACFSVAKNFFSGLNGFESSYAMDGFEDIDFCLKVWAAGCEVKVLPDVSVYRLAHSQTTQNTDPDLDLKIKLINSKQLNKKWGSFIKTNFSDWAHGQSKATSAVELRDAIQSLIG